MNHIPRITRLHYCAIYFGLYIILFGPSRSCAQDDRHYNTIQYGLRGMVMNGAMVAGVDDNSAIFYNPAALSISDKQGLDISLFAVSYSALRYNDAFETGTDKKSTNLELTPGLITLNFRPFKNKDISLSAGTFTRYNFRNVTSEQYTMTGPSGIQVNSIESEHSGREFWMAAGIAYLFERNVAIGMSQYLSLGSLHNEHVLAYQLFDPEEVGSLLFEDRESLIFKQSHTIGLINKFGFTWKREFFKLGATFTTPMYARVFKSTKVFYQRSHLDETGATAETYSFNNKGAYKTPFVARLGLEFAGKGFLIATSVEYFHKVDEYNLIRTAEKDLNPPVNGTNGFNLTDSRKGIINLNLGWEVNLDKRFGYLGGIRTNFNYNDLPADYSEPRLHWSYFDIYHITNGMKVNVDRSNFTIGIDYAFSFNDNLPPQADLSAASIQEYSERNSSVAYNNLTFLFTYNFILDKVSEIMD